MERRLIDAKEAYELACEGGYYGDFALSLADLTSLKELLDDCPTIDAVEVVRCRECKHYRPYEDEECGGYRGKCTFLVGLEGCMYETDYCSYGERREPDGE